MFGGSLNMRLRKVAISLHSFVEQYADGRIFTGEAAVKLGFADQVGTLKDAEKAIGRLTGLGDSPEIFEIPKKHNNVLELLMDDGLSDSSRFEKILKSEINKLDLLGKPLFLMPGSGIFVMDLKVLFRPNRWKYVRKIDLANRNVFFAEL